LQAKKKESDNQGRMKTIRKEKEGKPEKHQWTAVSKRKSLGRRGHGTEAKEDDNHLLRCNENESD
jgi:hypothetical protein